ncbi:serine/threonine-protein kinase [Chiayiivirga flava]|uniref:Serine/threonine-protein kinase n=1 Tax=Chiayiivirga flava TaxID=659595 RepID=A0A7W8D5B1_9GAMM|nr:serine/threonine-protein kinase [Chiayiivirga flava]MBB5208180.1 serine/threonine-protein kinase [Chiayiivirga flava]
MSDDTAAARLLTPQRCVRLRDAFDTALELPTAARAGWIAAHIADNDDRAALSLLLRQADADDGPLDLPPEERLRRVDAAAQDPASVLVGRHIGAYRLVRCLGEGGMATVFLGERDDDAVRQIAAVKLLRVGLYSAHQQRLFRRERRALAALSHPNIAHLIDGGVSEAGVPYLVLEYVDGVPITQHAAERGLDRDARLRLFVTACLAVAAAHRQLIVHRDLKPSNILVTRDGDVKLLDFGIAKLLDDDDGHTRSTLAAMTPEYAAPEQFDARPVTTATDVYSLGIVLHELLLGRRPANDARLRPGAERAARTASDSAPPSPVTLRGDLATILGKALAPEPQRRYGSAQELADDVERFLAARPVRAHPPSRWYRARTFVRRHRGGVALTFAFVVGMLASLALALWQAGEARREAANARAEAQRADTTRAFVESFFEPIQQQLSEGRTPSLRELVDTAASQVEADRALGAAQRVDLLLLFARLQAQLAERSASLQLAERAHAIAQSALPPDSPLRTQATHALARARMRNDDMDGAAPLLREVQRWQATHAAAAADRIELLADLAVLENEAGNPAAALPHAERELALRIATHGPESSSAASGYNNLGYVLEAMGRLDEAIAAYRHTLAIDDRRLDPGSLQRVFPIGNLAQALFNAGRLTEARTLFGESLALYREVALDKPPRTLLGQLIMAADTELALGDLAAAETHVDALQRWLAPMPPDSIDHATLARLRARLELERGDIDDADGQLQAMDALIDALPEPRRRRSFGYRDMLRAEIALLSDDDRRAAALAVQAADSVGDQSYPLYIVPQARALRALACERARIDGCPADAFEIAAAQLRTPPFREHAALLQAHVALARVELLRGEALAADTRLRALVAWAQAAGVSAQAPRLRQAQAWQAAALAASGKCDAARAARQAATASRNDDAAALHPFVTEAVEYGRTVAGCP